MIPVDVIAAGAVSALGSGPSAWCAGSVGHRATSAVARDEALAAAGLRRPFVARVPDMPPEAKLQDRGSALLAEAARQLVVRLDAQLPAWRTLRVGACLGTSGGGMSSLERAVESSDRGEALSPVLARSAAYFGPFDELDRALGVELAPRAQILSACASSTFALGIGCRWLEADEVDLVIAGGYDGLCAFIAAGFECLGATTASCPAPFRRERDGLGLGEGAGLVALALGGRHPSPLGRVLGFSGSCDAVHVTAPDRSGQGLTRAARAALDDARCAVEQVRLVSAHGTATAYNDAAEAKAMAAVLGEHVAQAVVQPFKAVIGHTLGAAGVLETLAALDAMHRGLLPAAAGAGRPDPELGARLLERAEAGVVDRCLKLSSAFGGANAALVLGRAGAAEGASGAARASRPVGVLAVGRSVVEPDLEVVARVTGADPSKLVRSDPLSQLVLTAVAHAVEHLGAPLAPGDGLVLGSAASTLELDAEFERRRRRRGPEPRRFPATSPNLACGESSIAFGLGGPCFAVGASPAAALEALVLGHGLVASGDAERVVVVAAELVGPFVQQVWQAAGWPAPTPGAGAVVLGVGADALDRRQLAEIHRASRADSRSSGASPAGWPALFGAIARSRAPGPGA